MTTRDRARALADGMTADMTSIATNLPSAMVVLRDAQPGPRSTPTDAGTRAAMNQWAALDGAMARAEERGLLLSGEQRAAFEHVTNARGLSVVVGYAGTGKSAMLGVAREAMDLLASLGTIEAGEALIRLVYAEALWTERDPRTGAAGSVRSENRGFFSSLE